MFSANNDLVGPRKSQLTNQFVESMMTKTPSAKKPDQDKPNPSSMFTPRHYDFSDTSDMSFCMDNNMNTLKGITFSFSTLQSWIYLILFYFVVYWLYRVQLIKYRCTEGLFEISASVPTYPGPSRTQSQRAAQTIHRLARLTICHVLTILLIEGFHRFASPLSYLFSCCRIRFQ